MIGNEKLEQAKKQTVEPVDLQIDDQVTKLFELSHQLTYFVVTAAVGTVAFTASFVKGEGSDLGVTVGLKVTLAIAAIIALVSAGLSLRALHHDIASFRLHLQLRYERSSYEQLPPVRRDRWDRLVREARSFREWAFVCLVVSVAGQIAVLFLAL